MQATVMGGDMHDDPVREWAREKKYIRYGIRPRADMSLQRAPSTHMLHHTRRRLARR